MQIVVKSTSLLKSGTNKNGDWEFVKVTDNNEDEYTTFAENAKLITSGSTIKITEPDNSGKFESYEIDSGGVKPAQEMADDRTKGLKQSKPEEFAPQEIGMWYKSCGDDLRADAIPEEYKQSARNVYFQRMFKVLGITKKGG